MQTAEGIEEGENKEWGKGWGWVGCPGLGYLSLENRSFGEQCRGACFVAGHRCHVRNPCI